MARSELILSLVKAGASGDATRMKSCVEALAADENSKNHTIFAKRILQAYQDNQSRNQLGWSGTSNRQVSDYVIEKEPTRKFGELVLPDLAKSALDQLVEEQQRSSLLRAHSIEPRNKVLLVGPPGNGKTSVAEAIAEALMIPFFVVRYESVIGSYLGETASRLRKIFEYAKIQPCVLFFDEFDALGKERGDEHETGEIKRVVTSLLLQFDSLPSYTVLVAATNHHELLDRAAWRRFQLRIHLPKPSRSQLGAYIDRRISALEEPMGIQGESIARRLGPISFAEAEEFCLDVVRNSILRAGSVTLKQIIRSQLNIWASKAGQMLDIEGSSSHGVSVSKDSRSNTK